MIFHWPWQTPNRRNHEPWFLDPFYWRLWTGNKTTSLNHVWTHDCSWSKYMAFPHIFRYQTSSLQLLYFANPPCIARRPGPWPWLPRRRSTFLIFGVYAKSWIYIGQSTSSTTRYDQDPINHHYQTQSMQDVFDYLHKSTELTPPRTTRGHYGPVSQACQRTETGDLAGQDRRGYEQRRVTFARSSFNLGLASAYRCAQNRTAWRELMEMATSMTSSRWWWWWWWWWWCISPQTAYLSPCKFFKNYRSQSF